MARARARLEEAEAALEELEGRQTGHLDTDQETELLENIKSSHELLEAERRMTHSSDRLRRRPATSLSIETQGSLEAAEVTMGEMEHSRLEMSHNSGELESMQGRREEVTCKLQREKKFANLDARLRQPLVGGRSEGSSVDSGTITWAEADRVSGWVENNIAKITTYSVIMNDE